MDPPRAPVSSTSMVTSCVLPSAFDRVPLKVVVRPDTADSDVKRTASARSVFFSTYRITWFGSTIWAPPLVASTHRTLDPVGGYPLRPRRHSWAILAALRGSLCKLLDADFGEHTFPEVL